MQLAWSITGNFGSYSRTLWPMIGGVWNQTTVVDDQYLLSTATPFKPSSNWGVVEDWGVVEQAHSGSSSVAEVVHWAFKDKWTTHNAFRSPRMFVDNPQTSLVLWATEESIVCESQGSLRTVQVSFRVQVSLRKVQLLFKCLDVNKGQVVLHLLKILSFFYHSLTRSSVILNKS